MRPQMCNILIKESCGFFLLHSFFYPQREMIKMQSDDSWRLTTSQIYFSKCGVKEAASPAQQVSVFSAPGCSRGASWCRFTAASDGSVANTTWRIWEIIILLVTRCIINVLQLAAVVCRFSARPVCTIKHYFGMLSVTHSSHCNYRSQIYRGSIVLFDSQEGWR